MKELVTLSSIVSRKENIFTSEVDGETVMMNVETGKYTCMNTTGNSIWLLIEKPIELNKVCSFLLEEFDVESSVCEKEVLNFVNNLNENMLINIH